MEGEKDRRLTSLRPEQRWPLIGRNEELRLALEIVAGRTPRSLVIAGQGGVGKSRLAAEIGDALRRRGWETREVTATRGAAAIPFGALSFALPNTLMSGADPFDFLRRAEKMLIEAAGSHRLALIVDDAHLLDPASAAFVHQIATSRAIVVVATIRSGEEAPDAITGLWKDEVASRLDLQALGSGDIEILLMQVLDGHIEGRTLQDLIRASQGNVLYLRELLHLGLSAGALTPDRGVWCWAGPMYLRGGLLDLIEDRVRAVGAEVRGLLTALALEEPLELAVLQRLASPAEIDSADYAGLLRVTVQGRRAFVALVHPLYGDGLRQLASPLQIRGLSGRIADGIEATGGRRADDPLRIGILRLSAGQSVPLSASLAAARRAFALADVVLAERFARLAVEASGGFEAVMLRAQALSYLRRCLECEQLLASTVASNDAEAGQLAQFRAWNLAYGLNRIRDAEQVLEVAGKGIADAGSRDDLAATRSSLLMSEVRLSDAIAAATPVIERSIAGHRPLTTAYATVFHSHLAIGRPLSAVAVADAGMAKQIRADQPLDERTNVFLYGRFRALLFAGLVREAGDLAMDTYRRAQEARWTRGLPYWAYCLGLVSFWTGRVRTAIGWLSEANRGNLGSDPSFLRLSGAATLVMAAWLAGRAELAAQAMAELDSLDEGYRINHAWPARARAWNALFSGNREKALGMLLETASDCRQRDYVAMEAIFLHDLARFGSPVTVAPRLSEIASHAEGRLFPALAQSALSLETSEQRLLEQSGNTFQALELNLEAAEAFAVAARLSHKAGRQGSASLFQHRARSLLKLCEDAQSPALVGMELKESLSKRELEIGGLAAKGLSNREIGRRLGISARTVENHLQHIFARLELHSRGELAAALGIRPERQR